MESALDEMDRHCGDLVQRYQACVTQNPNSWSSTCAMQRRHLTDCAEENVSSIKKVKEVCKVEVKAYDECLETSNGDPKPCLAALKALYTCTRTNSPQPLNAPGPPSSLS